MTHLRQHTAREAGVGSARLQVHNMSALTSVRYDPNSRTYGDRKRAEGERHSQAVIALARRRVNVLWALIRDGRPYEVAAPQPTGQSG